MHRRRRSTTQTLNPKPRTTTRLIFSSHPPSTTTFFFLILPPDLYRSAFSIKSSTALFMLPSQLCNASKKTNEAARFHWSSTLEIHQVQERKNTLKPRNSKIPLTSKAKSHQLKTTTNQWNAKSLPTLKNQEKHHVCRLPGCMPLSL